MGHLGGYWIRLKKLLVMTSVYLKQLNFEKFKRFCFNSKTFLENPLKFLFHRDRFSELTKNSPRKSQNSLISQLFPSILTFCVYHLMSERKRKMFSAIRSEGKSNFRFLLLYFHLVLLLSASSRDYKISLCAL